MSTDDDETKNLKTWRQSLVKLSCHSNSWQAERWTDLTSEADVSFIASPSLPCESTTCLPICLRWWRTCLPKEPWEHQNPCGLFCTSLMTQYLQVSQWERRQVPFYNAQWEREGKTDRDKEGGRGRGREEEEHKRLLLVMCMPLKSTQGWGAPVFSSLSIQAAHFTKHLRMTLSI